jgi:hypothetical protein
MQQLWNVTLKEYNVGEFLSILQLSNIRKTSMLYTKLSNINEMAMSGPQGVISHNIKLFITTALRTSNRLSNNEQKIIHSIVVWIINFFY